jgi:hypothetical protein
MNSGCCAARMYSGLQHWFDAIDDSVLCRKFWSLFWCICWSKFCIKFEFLDIDLIQLFPSLCSFRTSNRATRYTVRKNGPNWGFRALKSYVCKIWGFRNSAQRSRERTLCLQQAPKCHFSHFVTMDSSVFIILSFLYPIAFFQEENRRESKFGYWSNLRVFLTLNPDFHASANPWGSLSLSRMFQTAADSSFSWSWNILAWVRSAVDILSLDLRAEFRNPQVDRI